MKITVFALLVSTISTIAFAEVRDLRSSEELKERVVAGVYFSCDREMTSREVRNRAIEQAKNKGEDFCRGLGADSVEFSRQHTNSEWVTRTSGSRCYIVGAEVVATCQ